MKKTTETHQEGCGQSKKWTQKIVFSGLAPLTIQIPSFASPTLRGQSGASRELDKTGQMVGFVSSNPQGHGQHSSVNGPVVPMLGMGVCVPGRHLNTGTPAQACNPSIQEAEARKL